MIKNLNNWVIGNTIYSETINFFASEFVGHIMITRGNNLITKQNVKYA